MKNLIKTLKNIWKIEELRKRIITTLVLVMVYRLGSYIILPGIDSKLLAQINGSSDSKSILDIINAFTGGAFANASIFALGIMPYISASIIVQLLGIAIPYFQKLQKEGESGRNRLNQITRALTVLITMAQAPGYLNSYIPAQTHSSDPMWMVMSVVILVAGTIFVMWLGERITDRGIGNGISLIIMIGIIASLPQGMIAEFADKMQPAGGGLVIFLLEMIVLLLVIIVSILLVQGTRKIPISVARAARGNGQFTQGVRQFLPLKINSSGVMPIIFAQAIMFIPIMLFGFVGGSNVFTRAFSDYTGFWYNFSFALMIILFTYFYTALTVNPNQIADDLKRNNGHIPGIKPGKKTAEYIDTIMSRITLPGSFFLAFVAILPAFAIRGGVNQSFAQFFGGTSLLILVGVVLDTLQQIESYLLMRQYDGLMKSGRIKGRSSSIGAAGTTI